MTTTTDPAAPGPALARPGFVLEQARQLWSSRRRLVAALELPPEEHRQVVKAVRRSVVFRAVHVDPVAVGRMAGRTALVWAALGMACVALARPRGWADGAATLAGVLAGLLLSLALVGVLLAVADRVTFRWPGAGPVAETAVWSMKVLGATAAAVSAAGEPAGFVSGLVWGVPAFVAGSAAASAGLLRAGRRWYRRHATRLLSATAAELMLTVAGKLTEDRRAWSGSRSCTALVDELQRHAVRVGQTYRTLGRGLGWWRTGRADRADIRVRSGRLQQAVLQYRRELLDVTGQHEYDQLVDRVRQQVVALAGKRWDTLPAFRDGGARVAGAVLSTVTLGTALGLAVNAASEHLPGFMDRPVPAWAVVGALTLAGALAEIRRRGGTPRP